MYTRSSVYISSATRPGCFVTKLEESYLYIGSASIIVLVFLYYYYYP